jgi:DNA (cytosine-5)-methyltransferase 1
MLTSALKIEQIKKMKYQVSYEVVNCADYGIPQNRNRLVFLASKLGDISVPQKTHKKNEHISIEKIIKSLPVLKSGEVCKKDKVHKTRNLSQFSKTSLENLALTYLYHHL